MSSVVVINGSPSDPSSTENLLAAVSVQLREHGHTPVRIRLRDLPAEALVGADARHPAVAAAIAEVLAADALVVASPVYKATYSGLLKIFVDLLPPDSLAGTPVLPFVTGGSVGHVLALDHGLKPLLAGLGATTIARGRFVESAHIGPAGVVGPAAVRVAATVDDFALDLGLRARPGLTAAGV